MKLTELLLFGVAGWAGIGAVGVAISLRRGRRAEALKNAAWVATVAGAYLVLLLLVSVFQQQKLVRIGQDQCFDEMCFAVTGVDEVPGLISGLPDRVIRVQITVANRGRSPHAEKLLTACLTDAQGRTWQPLAGLSGNALTSRVTGGSQMVSQPMFRVAKGSTGLSLIFTHGNWQPGRLVVGDSESLAHRPTLVPLGR